MEQLFITNFMKKGTGAMSLGWQLSEVIVLRYCLMSTLPGNMTHNELTSVCQPLSFLSTTGLGFVINNGAVKFERLFNMFKESRYKLG